MEPIGGQQGVILFCLARTGCDVDVVHFLFLGDLPVGGIKRSNFFGDSFFSPLVVLSKGCNTPIGDGQDKDTLGAFFGVSNGGMQQDGELLAVFGDGAAAVLVVDAYEQGDYIVGGGVGIGFYGGHEFVCGPAGGGYYFGVAEGYALAEKDGGGLDGEGAIAGNGFAYGVGIAQT